MATRAIAVLLVCAGSGFLLAATDARSAESRAEVQINLCSAPTRVISALGLAEKGKPTTVWLFDSPALELNRQGLRLRLRQQGKGSELTLKSAGQNCTQVDAALLKPDGKCEADLHGDSLDDVVSLTRRLDRQEHGGLLAPGASRGAVLAKTLVSTLAPNQRTMLAAQRGVAGDSALLPDDIARLGPSTVRAYRGRKGSFVVEVWTLPGGQQFVELSEKVRREEALARRAELTATVGAAGVAICPDQDSQARKKLEILGSLQ